MAVVSRILFAIMGVALALALALALAIGMVVLFLAHQILMGIMDPPLCPLFEDPKGCVLNPPLWVDWTAWVLGLAAAGANLTWVLLGLRKAN